MDILCKKHRATWHEFVADLCHRFCDKELTNVIEEFNKLFQHSSVDEYQTRFEGLQPFMLHHNSQLGEAYFVSNFISGLKEEIKHKVKVHAPTSLIDAYRKAKLYELALEVENIKQKYPYKQLPSSSTPFSTKTQPQPTQEPPKPITPQPNHRQTLLEYRRNNNLCFKCGNIFGPGHQCQPKHLHLMEEDELLEDTT
ncbi:hypothetical protein GQ457_14G000540 [Hibiscus cannabinus]